MIITSIIFDLSRSITFDHYSIVDRYQSKSDIAAFIREQFDKRYMPRWHCIVADDFGYSVVPDPMNYICFELGSYGVLLFKSG
uniref:Dynein light chain n=1 Tax=Ascaris lumbricoides TaxID=6252 RepID=A0A0M3HN06_ASCLU